MARKWFKMIEKSTRKSLCSVQRSYEQRVYWHWKSSENLFSYAQCIEMHFVIEMLQQWTETNRKKDEGKKKEKKE